MSDKIEEKILSILIQNSRLSARAIAKKLSIHPMTVISKIKKLEEEKVILGYGVNLDLGKLGYEFLGIVQIKISKGKLLETQQKISKMPGVISVYDVTGEYDSVVMIAAKNRSRFSEIIKSILSLPFVEHTNTQVILQIVKSNWEFKPI
jgi:DNA-binding Lrp family transcriptional regulator